MNNINLYKYEVKKSSRKYGVYLIAVLALGSLVLSQLTHPLFSKADYIDDWGADVYDTSDSYSYGWGDDIYGSSDPYYYSNWDDSTYDSSNSYDYYGWGQDVFSNSDSYSYNNWGDDIYGASDPYELSNWNNDIYDPSSSYGYSNWGDDVYDPSSVYGNSNWDQDVYGPSSPYGYNNWNDDVYDPSSSYGYSDWSDDVYPPSQNYNYPEYDAPSSDFVDYYENNSNEYLDQNEYAYEYTYDNDSYNYPSYSYEASNQPSYFTSFYHNTDTSFHLPVSNVVDVVSDNHNGNDNENENSNSNQNQNENESESNSESNSSSHAEGGDSESNSSSQSNPSVNVNVPINVNVPVSNNPVNNIVVNVPPVQLPAAVVVQPQPQPQPQVLQLRKIVENLSFPNGTQTDNTALVGETLRYSLGFQNTSNSTLNNVQILDVLPSNTAFVSAANSGTFNSSTNAITWNLGNLAPGASVVVSYTARVTQAPAGTIITNTALLRATNNADIISNETRTRIVSQIAGAPVRAVAGSNSLTTNLIYASIISLIFLAALYFGLKYTDALRTMKLKLAVLRIKMSESF